MVVCKVPVKLEEENPIGINTCCNRSRLHFNPRKGRHPVGIKESHQPIPDITRGHLGIRHRPSFEDSFDGRTDPRNRPQVFDNVSIDIEVGLEAFLRIDPIQHVVPFCIGLHDLCHG